MEIATWIASLREEGARMTAAARATAADAPVPTCPGWVARDLIRHQGGVHRWATRVVADARTGPPSEGLEVIAGGWPGDEVLADWFEAGHLALVSALEAAPPDLQCWTFMPAPSPLAFWSRRQAHETAIHRVDELVSGFWPRRSAPARAETPVTLGLRCTDEGDAWVVTMGPDGVQTSAGAAGGVTAGEATCSVRGAAGDLYLALWNRGRSESLETEGDRAVLEQFGETMQVRWS
jgi:uncharacterized protein (TIGR03083 family)